MKSTDIGSNTPNLPDMQPTMAAQNVIPQAYQTHQANVPRFGAGPLVGKRLATGEDGGRVQRKKLAPIAPATANTDIRRDNKSLRAGRSSNQYDSAGSAGIDDAVS